jgi:hypothetical protein
MAAGPSCAVLPARPLAENYLNPLRLTHNYHYASNRPGMPAAALEVRLRDESGRVTRTLHFPDPKASFWVRQRQAILAQNLADDQPVQRRGSEAIPALHQKAPVVDVWDIRPDHSLALLEVPEHLLPRDRAVFRPSEWSRILARSYARHLCEEYGAASAEIIRHTRESALPPMMDMDEPPAEVLQNLVSSFGEYTK